MASMLPRFTSLLCAASVAAAAGGCAQVFGLDDYAVGTGGGAATTNSTAAGSGGDPGTTGSSTTSSANASTSASSPGSGGGPPDECRCIPAVPDGWTLVVAQPTTVAAAPVDCLGDRRVTVGAVSAECACTCAEQNTTCDPATLRCYEQAGCSGPVADFQPSGTCSAIGQRRSCEVLEGPPAGPTCQSDGVLGAEVGDAFDLCGATQRDTTACPETSRCAEAPPGRDVCISGEGACPAGWDLVQHDVADAGTFACSACGCSERRCEGARFRASGDWGLGAPTACSANFGDEVAAPGCADVTNPTNNPSQQARLLAEATLVGSCDVQAAVVAASYAPGPNGKLCCLPQEP